MSIIKYSHFNNYEFLSISKEVVTVHIFDINLVCVLFYGLYFIPICDKIFHRLFIFITIFFIKYIVILTNMIQNIYGNNHILKIHIIAIIIC